MEHEKLERRKRIKYNIIIFVLAALILLNLYQYSVNRNYTKIQESNNATTFHLISNYTRVLTERIDIFINYMNELDDSSNGVNDKTLARIHDNWRLIIGARDSLKFLEGRVAYHYLDELDEWQFVNLILSRANLEVYKFTLDFLEQGYDSLDKQEIENLRVISEIYQIISRGIVTEPELSLESNLVDSLLGPLQRLDEYYYSNFLQIREELTHQ